jgi:thiol:disulfide interchange protein DsbG
MKTLAAIAVLLLAVIASPVAAADGSALTGVDARIWDGLSRTSWIAQGDGTRIVYAYVDPNCPYSRDLYGKAQQLLNPAAVQIRWVPVGVLPKVTEDSRQKAAAALKGGIKTLDAVMRGKSVDVPPSPRELSQASSSAGFLDEIAKYAPRGVPKFIYVKDAGNEVRLVTGVPQQAELAKTLR